MIAGRIPPSSAWTIRAITRVSRLHASPHSADPPANPSSARLYTRLNPKRSPSHAVAGTTTPSVSEYAVTTHCESLVDTPNSFWMVGRATVTMLISRIDMNVPTISTASGSRQAVAAPSSPVPWPERLPATGNVASPLAGVEITPLAGLAPVPSTTTPRCHKKRQVLYLFSSRPHARAVDDTGLITKAWDGKRTRRHGKPARWSSLAQPPLEAARW